ncbi:MAG: histidine kinase [Taibaiella sp.]|nr:histidine kinase [Taibaiella sp.]
MQINTKLKDISTLLASRLVRNIIFWVYAIYQVLRQKSIGYSYSSGIYYLLIFITISWLATFSYINNLILLPKYLFKNKKNSYAICIICLTIFFASIHAVFLKTILLYYPQIKIFQISYITSPLSSKWSALEILKDILQFTIIYSFWALIFTMAGYMSHYNKQEKIIKEAEKKQIETELNFLKSQINPHFLFNNLNNIYALAVKNSEKTPEIILKLASLLRYLLYESNVKVISFEKEKEIMQAYIDLELLRLNSVENLNFSIFADKAYNLPPLLWLPILENIFKHGMRFISNQYYVDYRFTICDNIISIYSKNYFKELNSNNKAIGGIGLTNLNKRLELLYPDNYTANKNIKDNYYIVEVKIQL